MVTKSSRVDVLLPESVRHRRERDAITKAIRSAFPEVEYVATVGWCGPRWEDAGAMDAALMARRDAGTL